MAVTREVVGNVALDDEVREALRTLIRGEVRAVMNDVEDSFRLHELLDTLHQLPDAIRRQQETVANLRRQVEDARMELETAEAVLASAVAEAVDPKTGKALYSNETARKAALAQKRAEDSVYQAAAAKVRELESALASAQADLDLLLNRFTVARKIADLAAARLHLMAA